MHPYCDDLLLANMLRGVLMRRIFGCDPLITLARAFNTQYNIVCIIYYYTFCVFGAYTFLYSR